MSVRSGLRLRRCNEHRLRVFRRLTALQRELLNDPLLLVLRFQLHSALLPFGALQLELLLQKSVGHGR